MCLAHPFLLSCLLIPESLRASARSLSTFGAVPQAQPVSQRSGLTTVGSSFKGSLSLLAPLVRSLNVVVSQGVSPVSQRSGLISLVVSPKSVSWCHTHGDRLRIGYLLMWLRPIEECVRESIDNCYIFKIFYYLCSRFTSKVWNKAD